MMNWRVSLLISGPVTVKQRINIQAEKGVISHFFLTDVSVSKALHGVKIDIDAVAYNQSDANDAALYFVGQALDYLCLEINLPLYIGLSGTQIRPIDDNVRRVVSLDDWNKCFMESHEIGLNRSTYSRALSWYRKAKTSEDSIDAFLSYWSAIEGVGSKFANENERTKKGSVNQICDCFDQIWSGVSKWKVITNDARVLNDFNDKRNGIAHGFLRVDIETVKSISSRIPRISALAYEFLKDWEHKGTNLEARQNA